MKIFRPFIIFSYGLLLATLVLTPVVSSGQSTQTGDCTQPTPYIYQPTNGSSLAGNIAIEIYICPTVVKEMDVYAIPSSGHSIFIGVASQTQGTFFERWWDTTTVTNGTYKLSVKAQIGSGTLITISPDVLVNVANSATTTTPSSNTPTPKGKSPTPTPLSTPTSSSTPLSGTVINEEGVSTQTQNNVFAEAPKTEIPVATPEPVVTISSDNLMTGSQVISTVNFSLDSDKSLHLAKIEGRLSSGKTKFLLFTGKNYPNANVTLTIKSQPLVMTAKADSSGNWTYTLEKPLEPGEHQTYVQVNFDGQVQQSGPYPFNIARAQASSDNPTGSSLDLVDPQKQAIFNYLYAVGGLLGVAVLALIIFVYIKQVKKMRQSPNPSKEP